MIAEAQSDPGSFRDPAGQVYLKEGRILRSVTRTGASDYEYVRDSGLLAGLTDEGKVIGTREAPLDWLKGVDDCRYVLEHPKLPFVSYPYEWCFSALKAAALLQLDLMAEALKHNVMLSDASAYNIQFSSAEPVFIDVLSFRRYREGEYWSAHQQFCDQFLNPLILMALSGVSFNTWYRGNLEGICSGDLARLLPWYRKFSWRVMMHVTLPLKLQSRAQRNSSSQLIPTKTRYLPKTSLSYLVRGLRNWIEELAPKFPEDRTWSSYESGNSYDLEATDLKQEFTRRFVAAVKPSLLWDIGCNTGLYAETALKAGAETVIGFDTDVRAVEAAYSRAKINKLAFLPLIMDAADPSPGQGWRSLERKGLQDRNNADGLVAYAIVHHLSIGRNIPLSDVIAWLISLAPQGVIEFVEKADPMIQQMLRFREDVFNDYNRQEFLSAVQRSAEIEETCEVINDRRVLIRYRR